MMGNRNPSAAEAGRYYPVFLDLRGRSVIVVGGGEPAESRVERLLEAEAEVTVIAPQLTHRLRLWAAEERVVWVSRSFRPGDLAGARMVVTERLDEVTARAVFAEAEERNIFVSVEDDVPHCSFIFPSVIRRGDLTVAVSTSGSAPALAVRLRQELEERLGPEYATFTDLARRRRTALREAETEFEERRRRWYELVDSDVLELLRHDRQDEAERRADQILGLHS